MGVSKYCFLQCLLFFAPGVEVLLQPVQLDLADSGRNNLRLRDAVPTHAVSVPVARRLDGALPRLDQLHHVPQEVGYARVWCDRVPCVPRSIEFLGWVCVPVGRWVDQLHHVPQEVGYGRVPRVLWVVYACVLWVDYAWVIWLCWLSLPVAMNFKRLERGTQCTQGVWSCWVGRLPMVSGNGV